jgi:hypothetical protein
MAEIIPEVVAASENESKTVEIIDVNNKTASIIDLFLLNAIGDDDENWFYFGVGGPA